MKNITRSSSTTEESFDSYGPWPLKDVMLNPLYIIATNKYVVN